jgi:O-glycosyl hydrolase
VLEGWLGRKRPQAHLAVAVFLFISSNNLCAQTVTVNGSQVFQTIEGFGVNVNHRSWTNNELQPVLDAFIDQAGMTLFRIIWDNTDWEGTNDNTNANVMNWDYYNQVYSSPEFQQLWGIMGYLNQRGITNGVMVNFQGPGPEWLGGTNYLIAGYENEWAEMIASLFVYARNTEHLQFSLIAPDNEPDCYMGIYGSEGVRMTYYQYPTALNYLAQQLDNHGMSDVRFVTPDAQSGPGYLWQMMNDPVVMAKMAHVGVHSYGGGGDGSAGVQQILKDPPFNGMTFWMTEFNVWCTACEWAGTNTYSWDECRDTAGYLLAHLTNGASAGIVWEGYDSYYRILNNWSCWGLIAANGQFAVPRVYTPRKNFYTVAQISKFVRPGARRIAVSGSPGALQLVAFYHPDTGQLTLTGVNSSASPVSLSVTLASLPAVSMLDLYYTDFATNLAYGATCRVTNSALAATIPAKSVFTLVGQDPAKIVPRLALTAGSNNFTISWPGALTGYFLEATTNLGMPGAWASLTNEPQLAGGRNQVMVAPAGRQQHFRLHHY